MAGRHASALLAKRSRPYVSAKIGKAPSHPSALPLLPLGPGGFHVSGSAGPYGRTRRTPNERVKSYQLALQRATQTRRVLALIALPAGARVTHSAGPAAAIAIVPKAGWELGPWPKPVIAVGDASPSSARRFREAGAFGGLPCFQEACATWFLSRFPRRAAAFQGFASRGFQLQATVPSVLPLFQARLSLPSVRPARDGFSSLARDPASSLRLGVEDVQPACRSGKVPSPWPRISSSSAPTSARRALR